MTGKLLKDHIFFPWIEALVHNQSIMIWMEMATDFVLG